MIVAMLFKSPHLLEIHIEMFTGKMMPCLGFALKMFQPDKTKHEEKENGENTSVMRIAEWW